MSDTLTAWKIRITPELEAILPRQALGHLSDSFELLHVPLAPEYANAIYCWNHQLLPVMNLSAFVDLSEPTLLGILAYRRAETTKQGVITLFAPPELIHVPNEVCEWPEHISVPWAEIANSCVDVDGTILPIISPDKLFSYCA